MRLLGVAPTWEDTIVSISHFFPPRWPVVRRQLLDTFEDTHLQSFSSVAIFSQDVREKQKMATEEDDHIPSGRGTTVIIYITTQHILFKSWTGQREHKTGFNEKIGQFFPSRCNQVCRENGARKWGINTYYNTYYSVGSFTAPHAGRNHLPPSPPPPHKTRNIACYWKTELFSIKYRTTKFDLAISSWSGTIVI